MALDAMGDEDRPHAAFELLDEARIGVRAIRLFRVCIWRGNQQNRSSADGERNHCSASTAKTGDSRLHRVTPRNKSVSQRIDSQRLPRAASSQTSGVHPVRAWPFSNKNIIRN